MVHRINQGLFLFAILFCLANSTQAETKEEPWVTRVQSKLYEAPDSALALLDSVIPSLKGDQYALKAQGYRLAGIAYDVKGDYKESMRNYSLAMDEAKMSGDSIQMANILMAEGIIFHRFDNYEEALQLYLEARRIFESHNESKRLMAVLNNMGSLFNNLGLFDKGLHIYKTQISYGKAERDTNRLSSAYANIAHSYFGLDMLDSASFYNKKARALDAILNNTYSSISNLQTAGAIAMSRDQLDSAEYFYRLCLAPINGVFLSFNRSAIYIILAQIEESQGNLERALAMLDSSNLFLEPGTKSFEALSNISAMQAKIYFKLGLFEKAARVAFKASDYRDSLEAVKIQDILINLEIENASKGYRTELSQIREDNEDLTDINVRTSRLLYLSWTVGLLLIAFIAALYFVISTRSKYLEALNQRNAALQKDLELKERMISVLAHDFRTPLSGLLIMTDWLQKGDLDLNEIKEFSTKANATITKSLSSIDELLYYMTKDKKLLVKELVDVGDVIRDVIELNSLEIKSKTIQFNNDVVEGLRIRFDKTHLQIVARNIIGNSIKFLSDSGSIWVGASVEGAAVKLKFEDNGPGIPDDLLLLIEERNFSAIRPDRNGKGLGLGLQLVFELTEMNGGEVKISRIDNGGTRIVISIPNENTD